MTISAGRARWGLGVLAVAGSLLACFTASARGSNTVAAPLVGCHERVEGSRPAPTFKGLIAVPDVLRLQTPRRAYIPGRGVTTPEGVVYKIPASVNAGVPAKTVLVSAVDPGVMVHYGLTTSRSLRFRTCKAGHAWIQHQSAGRALRGRAVGLRRWRKPRPNQPSLLSSRSIPDPSGDGVDRVTYVGLVPPANAPPPMTILFPGARSSRRAPAWNERCVSAVRDHDSEDTLWPGGADWPDGSGGAVAPRGPRAQALPMPEASLPLVTAGALSCAVPTLFRGSDVTA
jgi:hypothetical protein